MKLISHKDINIGDCIMGYHICGIVTIGLVGTINEKRFVEFCMLDDSIVFVMDKIIHTIPERTSLMTQSQECWIFSNETIYLLSEEEINLHYLIYNI